MSCFMVRLLLLVRPRLDALVKEIDRPGSGSYGKRGISLAFLVSRSPGLHVSVRPAVKLVPLDCTVRRLDIVGEPVFTRPVIGFRHPQFFFDLIERLALLRHRSNPLE